MFSGIVEGLGRVRRITGGAAPVLAVDAPDAAKDLKIGDSIAVNGVCLTVVRCDRVSFEADVMPETLGRTDLGSLKSGDPVNLEKPLRLADRLGGHLVSGHVDGVGTIRSKIRQRNAHLMRISVPRKLARYLIPKGSVAVDGISVTVIDAGLDSFTVSIIPHTADVTTLGCKGPGAKINIEVDMVGKYVERFLKERR